MGYQTNFWLTVYDKNKIEIDSAIHPEWETDMLYDGTLKVQNLIDRNTDSMKWYDHKSDMLKLSIQYSKYLFILDGNGEESGDIWREFYWNGLFYRWDADIQRPDFDATQLMKP